MHFYQIFIFVTLLTLSLTRCSVFPYEEMPSEFRELIPKDLYDIYFNLTTEDRIVILQTVLEKNRLSTFDKVVSFIKRRRPIFGKNLEEYVRKLTRSIKNLSNESKIFLKQFSQQFLDIIPDREEAINFDRYKSFQNKFTKKFNSLNNHSKQEIIKTVPMIQLVIDKDALSKMINLLIVDN
ncbi:Nematode fatty acid retinoid binding family-containing protein [Strongyloides ratti]|uniref:Nematode fatty acid retinoid binding family-containing protein n=1 Tax=Strongyloides ratti TaxID=34506 RepID=A0A090LEQ2_STRRB|nr:Nematode fatty acid retinoid binding family-containing protein [Strongyloides ratti]CEF68236.1 Nematode fatty acid retinoid binding family-containing protein [Strongyloides ratti]